MIRWRSLRGRLWTIIVLLFLSLLAMIGINRLTSAHLDRQLDAIQGEYVPLLQYGPRVDAAFEDVVRRMQDAVAAQDGDVLETASLDDAFLELLHQAPARRRSRQACAPRAELRRLAAPRDERVVAAHARRGRRGCRRRHREDAGGAAQDEGASREHRVPRRGGSLARVRRRPHRAAHRRRHAGRCSTPRSS